MSQRTIYLLSSPQLSIGTDGSFMGLPIVSITTSTKGDGYDVDSIFEEVVASGIKNVVISGDNEDPLVQDVSVATLIKMFEVAQIKVQLSTQGKISVREFTAFRNAIINFNLSSLSSKESSTNNISSLNALRPFDVVTFHITSEKDYNKMKDIIEANRTQAQIVILGDATDFALDEMFITDKALFNLYPRDNAKFKLFI